MRRRRKGGRVWVDDSALRALHRTLRGQSRARVQVGVLQGQGGEQKAEGGITMAELAAIHEYGAPKAGIPERSFLRRTFNEKQDELKQVTEKLLSRMMRASGKNIGLVKVLERIGLWGAAAVKNTITEGEGVPPPNAPATIAKKKSDRPLVDTGRLVGSITHKVKL